MKTWLLGILFGGFLGFTIAMLAYLVELITYRRESTKRPLLSVMQLIFIIVVGVVAWRAQGVQALTGYVLGSFYIIALILRPYGKKRE